MVTCRNRNGFDRTAAIEWIMCVLSRVITRTPHKVASGRTVSWWLWALGSVVRSGGCTRPRSIGDDGTSRAISKASCTVCAVARDHEIWRIWRRCAPQGEIAMSTIQSRVGRDGQAGHHDGDGDGDDMMRPGARDCDSKEVRCGSMTSQRRAAQHRIESIAQEVQRSPSPSPFSSPTRPP